MRGSSQAAGHRGDRRGARAARVVEANGEGKDALLLADGNASSSEKRERFEKVTMGPLGPLAFFGFDFRGMLKYALSIWAPRVRMDFIVKFDGLTGYVCDYSQKWQCLVFAPRFQRSLPGPRICQRRRSKDQLDRHSRFT